MSIGRKSPNLLSSPWDFVTLPEEDRATDIGNRHRQTRRDRACGSGDILADRQTNTYTERHTHHNTSLPLPRSKLRAWCAAVCGRFTHLMLRWDWSYQRSKAIFRPAPSSRYSGPVTASLSQSRYRSVDFRRPFMNFAWIYHTRYILPRSVDILNLTRRRR